MHYDISFPNLGIYLDHVGKNISIFGFEIAYYGIIIGCAILIGFLIATSEAKRTRQNPEDYLDMGIIGVIMGIAGARIYYVVFSWDMYKDNLLDIFNFTNDENASQEQKNIVELFNYYYAGKTNNGEC